MSKNLTRKGFALGTVVALGASLFAGTPASAAPTALYLDTAFGTSGTTQTGVLGQYFVLAGSAAGGATSETVKYFIEGTAAANVEVRQRNTTNLSVENANTTVYGNAATPTTPTGLDASVAKSAISTTWTAGNYAQLAIKLLSGVTATTSIKVTPFLDSVIADNQPGPNELTGSSVTINFVKPSELSATPTLKALTLGSAAKATVAVSGGVNVSQFRATTNGGFDESPITVQFKKDGAVDGAVAKAYWTADSEFVAASPNVVAVGYTYGATALVNAVESASATAVKAGAGEVSTLTDVAISNSTSYRATAVTGTSTANVLRSGAGSIEAKTTVDAIAGKSDAGQTVTFTIYESAIASLGAGSVVAGGKTLTNADSAVADTISVDVVSGADGVAKLPISYTGLVAEKSFKVKATAKGESAVITPSTAAGILLTGQDSIATALVDEVATVTNSVRRVAKAGSFSVAYTLVDQFGQTPTGTFRAVLTSSGNPSITSPVAVSAGKVTLSGTDNSTVDGSYTVSATLQKLGTDGSTYSGLTQAVVTTSKISVGTVKTPATIAITAATTSGITRNTAAVTAGNTLAEQGSAARTLTGGQTISAIVTDSTGALVAGAPVTFTASGVAFQAGGTINTNDGMFGVGSITVYTDANGATGNVFYYSTNTGKQTITVTAGAAVKTQAISWAAVTSGGSEWAVTAPSYILPGQTLKVSAVLKDKFGAAVDTSALTGASAVVKVVYTGPGFVTATLPTATDEDGLVSFNVLLGALDSGVATVKFVYANTGGFDEVTLNDDVVKTVTINLGKAPVASATAAIAGSTKRFYVSVSNNAAAKNVVVKVAGKTVATLKGAAAKKTYTVKATKGSKKVTVYVGGKLIATKTVSVK